MKLFLISDNTDTLMGLRLAGIEGKLVKTKEEVLNIINECIENKEIGIVLCTTKVMALCPMEIADYKLNLSKPLIVEIPDRHGNSDIGKAIDEYISSAIGVKI
ncbi:MAG: V-type ATP synthase subunit F [Erysipelotrichaceae bacterium]